MADRTSAKIFGRFFQELADLPEEGQGPQRAKRISRDLVKLIRTTSLSTKWGWMTPS
jgi:hypothetical protein